MKLSNQIGFAKHQQKGLWLVLFLILSMSTYYLFDNFRINQIDQTDFTVFNSYLDSLDALQEESEFVLARFNPNKVSHSDLISMGVKSFVAERIIKYRSKGGSFQEPKDLLIIYGIDSNWVMLASDSMWFEPLSKMVKENNKDEEGKVILRLKEFNPNAVDYDQLIEFGLPKSLSASWVNYLAKGGHFKDCNDLKKLYSMSDDIFYQLINYCMIVEEELLIVDLNLADSAQLVQVKGIGLVYASRIIRYRNRLGGFHSIEQLLEVYGIDQTTLARFRVQIIIENVALKKLSINKEDFKILLKHPYLDYDQVRSIFDYRQAVGPIQDEADLLELDFFTAADILKLRAYLDFNK
jgi:competence ComEA-like helix-hairpin-helix protein